MKRTQQTRRMRLLAPLALALALVLAMLSASITLAKAVTPEDAPIVEPAASAYSAWDLEVGVYYMADYPGTSSDLPNAANNGWGFYNTLRSHPYTLWGYPRWCQVSGHDCFLWSDGNAWERDWTTNNNSWIDQVDYVFYEGHGWPGGFTLSAPNNEYVQHGEVQKQWGDVDLEWIFLLSCSVIADSSRGNWAGTMNGLHGIAGFRNTAYDVAGFGSTLATYLVFGYNIKDAWFKTCDVKQPGGVHAQIIVDEQKYFYETVYAQEADPVSPGGTYWWWWKSCGAPTRAALQPAQLNDTFPVFQVDPLSLDEANQEINRLASNFGIVTARGPRLTAADYITVGNSWVISSAGLNLEMDRNTGHFYLYQPANTFADTRAKARKSRVALSPAQEKELAQQVADAFLAENGLVPGGDAVFNMVDEIILGSSSPTRSGEAVSQEDTTGYQAIYNRYLTAMVENPQRGTLQEVQIPIDGPGAKVKVYIDPSELNPQAASLAQADDAVVGAMGGWRRIGATQRQGGGYPILPEDKVRDLFQVLEPEVAFGQVPFPDAKSKEVLSSSLTGWEEPLGEAGQDVIYPAYRFYARYERDVVTNGVTETVVFTDYTWMPANPEFMRPLAKIESHTPLSPALTAGQVFMATAVDATKTLAELGYGANLDFVPGSSDVQNLNDYVYRWYLGTVEDGKLLGSGRMLNYTLQAEDLTATAGSQPAITLQVQVIGHGHTSVDSGTIALQLLVSEADKPDDDTPDLVNDIFLPAVQR